jgi:hypothetical protein|eukprot:COSAG01_NODE_709_length_14119_cov_107.401213_11_plen_98_part_00
MTILRVFIVQLGAGLPPKGATVHSLGGARNGVDMSLVQRMEDERARAQTEGRLPGGGGGAFGDFVKRTKSVTVIPLQFCPLHLRFDCESPMPPLFLS